MPRLIVVSLLVLVTVLSGCSTMSKKECASADWYALGLQDGRSGQDVSRLAVYQESCEKHDIAVDQNNYRSGHQVGIREYCQPNTGYQLGLSGRSLPNVCPADLKTAFAQAHERGYTEFKIKRDINNAQAKIAQAEKAQPGLNDAVVNAKAALLAAETAEEKNNAQQQLDNALRARLQSFADQTDAVGALACASGDWYQAGIADGEAGRSAITYKRHLRLCESYHPAVNQSRYIQGQSDGLARYCTFDTGFALGQQGIELSSLCRGTGQQQLQAGFNRGLEEHDEKVTIAGLTQLQKRLQTNLPKLKTEQTRLQTALKEDGLSADRKLALTRELNRVNFQLTTQEGRLEDTTTELNCYVADWEVLGFQSGEQGERFNNTSRSCDAFGITVDTRLFEKGYQQGVARYCTKDNGRRMGQLGQEYQDVCPRSTEAAFLEGYLPAFEAYQRTQLKKQLAVDIQQSDKVLSSVRSEIDLLTQDLELTTLTRSERLNIINEIAQLARKEKDLATDLGLMQAHSQCLTDDWFALGQTHGSEGRSSQLRELDCPRFSLSPQVTDYRNGLTRGLQNWCTQSRGYDMALAGDAPTLACSRTSHRDYFRGYADGEQALAAQSRITQLKVEKLDLLEAIQGNEERIVVIDAALSSDTLSETSRRRLNQEKLTLQSQILQGQTRLEEIELALQSLGQ